MTITTFFSKEGRFPQLYRFTLRQNAGYFGLASLLIFLLYPVQYLMEAFKRIPEASYAYLPEAPDPFSNYHLYGLGRNFTEMSMVLFIRAPAEGLLAAVEEKAPFAGSYAAGFLCHFALDSACHPLVEEQVSHGLAHSAVESELDRTLMTAQGLDPLLDTPLPSFDLPDTFFSTVTAATCPGVTAEAFREALDSFCRVCRLQTRWAGTWASTAMDRLGGRFSQLSVLRGSLLTPRPDLTCAPAAETLALILEETVLPTVRAITEFFSAAARRGTLGSWYDRDYYGQSVPTLVTV